MAQLRLLLVVLAVAAGTLAAAPAAGAVVLFSQSGPGSGSVPTIPSFDDPDPAGDNQVADDFTIGPEQSWTLSLIRTVGVAQGSGTVTAAVFIYRDAGGAPGELIYSTSGAAPENGTCTNGQFCNLNVPIAGAPPLGPGTYWASVQTTGSFFWRWAVVTPGETFGAAARWQNPGNGFNRNCVTYAPLLDCNWVTASQGKDMSFALEGTFRDSAFSLGNFRKTGKRIGGVTALVLDATFPGAGKVIVRDAKLLRKGKKPKPAILTRKLNVPAGKRALPIRLTAASRARVLDGKRVEFRVAVTYTATDGVPATRFGKLRLVP